METLEQIANEKTPQVKAINTYELPKKAPEYKGLALLEEKSFDGPTSIKYWM
ncbi:MAG: hypothetical protein AABW53_00980 [Nanoarchaeota archaeon]